MKKKGQQKKETFTSLVAPQVRIFTTLMLQFKRLATNTALTLLIEAAELSATETTPVTETLPLRVEISLLQHSETENKRLNALVRLNKGNFSDFRDAVLGLLLPDEEVEAAELYGRYLNYCDEYNTITTSRLLSKICNKTFSKHLRFLSAYLHSTQKEHTVYYKKKGNP